jgi:predicted transcriptional regulator
MIEMFKENEIRNSGIIYSSTFEQIKKLYEADPEAAGELAIAAIELVLTGDISSDDMMVGLLLEPMRKINENNQVRYDNKVESSKNKKMIDMKLDKIAEMVNKGMRQREIGEALGLSQQNVSYRIGLIKSNYPDLLNGKTAKNSEEDASEAKHLTKIQTNPTKIQKNFTKNTKIQTGTKNESFVDPVNPDIVFSF